MIEVYESLIGRNGDGIWMNSAQMGDGFAECIKVKPTLFNV
jgi:hypothetical protein